MIEHSRIGEYLNEHGTLTYTNVGTSMMPLLRQGKDLFTVRKKGIARCSVRDVVLYVREPDRYVLHRVISVRPDDYVIIGDNCIKKEYGITDKDIIGIMTSFVRNSREHSTDEPLYRVYSFVIMHTIRLRRILKVCKKVVRKILKRR